MGHPTDSMHRLGPECGQEKRDRRGKDEPEAVVRAERKVFSVEGGAHDSTPTSIGWTMPHTLGHADLTG